MTKLQIRKRELTKNRMNKVKKAIEILFCGKTLTSRYGIKWTLGPHDRLYQESGGLRWETSLSFSMFIEFVFSLTMKELCKQAEDKEPTLFKV